MAADRKRRVLLLIPNLDFGGAQRAFSKLSLGLQRHFDVYVAVFNTFEGVAFPLGGKLLDLEISGAPSIPGKLRQFRRRIQKVRELKRRYDIDVCLSFLEGADYVNLLSKGREKTIISVRGSKVHDEEISGLMGQVRKRLLMPLTYRKADAIVAVSEGIKQELVDIFGQSPQKVRVIYNYYEAEPIRAQAAQPIDPAYEPVFRHPVIIGSGRLHQQKTFAPLLDGFAQVAPRHPRAKLVILGDGGLRADLLARTRNLGLRVHDVWSGTPVDDTCQVFFLGYQANPFAFLSRATLFAFPSSWEGFPNALAEAMICGLPVVSADCATGPREILAPGTGPAISIGPKAEEGPHGILMPLLNQPDNTAGIAEWARVLTELLADEPRRRDLAARAVRRMEDFSKERVFRQWEELLS